MDTDVHFFLRIAIAGIGDLLSATGLTRCSFRIVYEGQFMMALIAEAVTGEGLLIRLVESSPVAVAILVLVYYFIRHLEKRDTSAQSREAAFLDYVRQRDKAEAESKHEYTSKLTLLGDNCHAFQRDLAAKYEAASARMSASLDRNTEMFGRNSQALEQAIEALAEFHEKESDHAAIGATKGRK